MNSIVDPSDAQRRPEAIDPFHVVELLTRAKDLEATGKDVIHMEVGEPDFPTPPQIIAAATEALQSKPQGYTPALGIPELRLAISNFYRTRHGVHITPERVVVTAGASGALMLACATLVEPGSQWLLPDPGYPCNRAFIRAFEGRPIPLPTAASNRFQPTAKDVSENWRRETAGVLIASPANPTGTRIESDALREIAAEVARRSGTLIVDEIYSELSYDGESRTALSDPEIVKHDPWIVQSFSKYWQMTGWRLGWLIVPEARVRSVEKLAQNLFIAPSTIAQYAAVAAFRPDTLALVEMRRQTLGDRRNLLLPKLESLGFEIPVRPDGAFYIYADASRLTRDSYDFSLRLLDEALVAVTPGIDFGRQNPERYVRFAYTTGVERIAAAGERIESFLRK